MSRSGAPARASSSARGDEDAEEEQEDLYGACRPVSSYQKLNQIGQVSPPLPLYVVSGIRWSMFQVRSKKYFGVVYSEAHDFQG